MDYAILKAKELADSILQSKEYIEYQKCKLDVEDLGLSSKLAVYENAKNIITLNKIPKENKIYKDALEVVNECEGDEVLSAYFRAKDKLNFLLNAINNTLSHITGMDSGEKSCGGCGCGGCKK